MNDRHMWFTLALLLLTPAARAADRDAEPLPAGAKYRLGTDGIPFGAHLLAPDCNTFLLGGPRLRDARTGKTTIVPGFETDGQRQRLPQDGAILAVSADGKRAVTGQNFECLVFEVATGRRILSVKSADSLQNAVVRDAPVSLSADGKVMSFCARDFASVQEIKYDAVVWDVENDRELARMPLIQNGSLATVLSPDGKTLATHGELAARAAGPKDPRPDTAVQLWNVGTGKLIATLPDVFDEYATGRAVVFSPDSKTLATATGQSPKGVIRLWEANTGKPKDPILGRPFQSARLAFSPDGKTLAAVGQRGTIDRWTLTDNKPLPATTFPTTEWAAAERVTVGPSGLAFTDNERVVAWGRIGSHAVIWDAPGGKLLTPLAGHTAVVNAVQFAAGGKELATLGADFRLMRWNAATGKRLGTTAIRLQEPHGALTDLAPGGALAMRYGLLYDVKAGEELFTVPAWYVSPASDYRLAAGFVRSPDRASTLAWCEVWNLETRRRQSRFELPAPVQFNTIDAAATAFSPDNSRLVTAVHKRGPEPDGNSLLFVTGWDVKDGKKLGELCVQMTGGPAGPLVTSGRQDRIQIAAAGNNAGAVLATEDGKLWLANYERGERGDTIDHTAGAGRRFTCPTFSPDGKMFAVGVPADKGDGFAVRVYDWPRGKPLHTFTGHRGPVTALAFSPDGKSLASGSFDTTVLVWDLTVIPKPK